jgi:hypothetical protein
VCTNFYVDRCLFFTTSFGGGVTVLVCLLILDSNARHPAWAPKTGERVICLKRSFAALKLFIRISQCLLLNKFQKQPATWDTENFCTLDLAACCHMVIAGATEDLYKPLLPLPATEARLLVPPQRRAADFQHLSESYSASGA